MYNQVRKTCLLFCFMHPTLWSGIGGFIWRQQKYRNFYYTFFIYKLETRNINLHASKTKVERVHIEDCRWLIRTGECERYDLEVYKNLIIHTCIYDCSLKPAMSDLISYVSYSITEGSCGYWGKGGGYGLMSGSSHHPQPALFPYFISLSSSFWNSKPLMKIRVLIWMFLTEFGLHKKNWILLSNPEPPQVVPLCFNFSYFIDQMSIVY